MKNHAIVQIVCDDRRLNASLAAVIATIPGCGGRVSTAWSEIENNRSSSAFLIVGILDPHDIESSLRCREALVRLGSSQHGPGVILIANDLEPGLHHELIELGASEVLERPINLQRLRYLIESKKIDFQHRALRYGDQARGAAQPGVNQFLEEKIAKVAGVDSNILLTGETGVGKTFLAEKIHHASRRSRHHFVVVNCANIPHDLFESELFGHSKSAFTGADKRRIGQFEHAGSGTIFLDEVDSLPRDVQAKLLRVVDSREFRPIGENRTVQLKARVISATNQPLLELVERGEFRADLYYRLNSYELAIPSLRERTDEIEQFCHLFADSFAHRNRCPRPAFADDLIEMLEHYQWPGNLRELKNCVDHGAIDSDDHVIRTENLPGNVSRCIEKIQSTDGQSTGLALEGYRMDEAEFMDAWRLISALKKTNFNRSEAAKELGVCRMTVYNMLKRHGLT